MTSYSDKVITPKGIRLGGHFPSYGKESQHRFGLKEPSYLENLVKPSMHSRKPRHVGAPKWRVAVFRREEKPYVDLNNIISHKPRHFDPFDFLYIEPKIVKKPKERASRFLSLDDESHIEQCREYYEKHRNELEKEHYGEYIAIRDENIIAISPTFDGLVTEVMKQLKKKKFKHRPHLMRIRKNTAVTSLKIE
ncbi:MAG: hypothetical protein A7316_07300 [Candidatus Altiarchaeales archaeon WOR_SM1_86-2]|nr:MAG: hypothetical protein A7316_07300 [Candidatus Altiarchaeales archaeon WOR_SM1_86-2]ODS40065.1 MAG: hypothetical protein A7315_09680 [Candidatus Altiarchaeales archaeon WOR_SM1_79]